MCFVVLLKYIFIHHNNVVSTIVDTGYLKNNRGQLLTRVSSADGVVRDDMRSI